MNNPHEHTYCEYCGNDQTPHHNCSAMVLMAQRDRFREALERIKRLQDQPASKAVVSVVRASQIARIALKGDG